MKILGIVVVAFLLAGGFLGCAFSTRNSLIAKDEGVNRAWSNVESTYQRRLDLIPNLVETVKGAAKFEGETLVKVTEKRNQILGLAKELGEAVKGRDTQKMDAIEGSLLPAMRAYTGLATEAYPNLKTTEQFAGLSSQLEGTENRINVARRDYNDAVASLNTSARQWGWLPFCGGFKVREPFKAQAAAAEAPKVDFK